jgi:hypothetical protein
MRRAGLIGVRVGLPLAMVLVGAGLIALGPGDVEDGAGVFLIGAAALVALFNVFIQLGNRSGADREREEAARRYFGEHGHWPDERRRR